MEKLSDDIKAAVLRELQMQYKMMMTEEQSRELYAGRIAGAIVRMIERKLAA